METEAEMARRPPEVALISLIEDLPELLAPEFVDRVETHFAGTGDHLSPRVLDAVATYRRTQVSPPTK